MAVTVVFDARGPQGLRFTLAEPWSVLLLDDVRVPRDHTDSAAGREPARTT
jgi:hypothetical protein